MDQEVAFGKLVADAGMHPQLAAAYDAAAESLAKDAGCSKRPAVVADCAKAELDELKDAGRKLAQLRKIAETYRYGKQLPADYYGSQLAGGVYALGPAAKALGPDLADFSRELRAKLDVWNLPTLAADWTKLNGEMRGAMQAASEAQSLVAAVQALQAQIASSRVPSDYAAVLLDAAGSDATGAGCAKLPASAADCAKGDAQKLKAAVTDVGTLTQKASNAAKYGGKSPVAFYQGLFDGTEKQRTATAEVAWIYKQSITMLNIHLGAPLNLASAGNLDQDWYGFSKDLQSAQQRMSYIAGLKSTFNSHASAALAAIAAGRSLPPAAVADLNSQEAALAAKVDCKGTCDSAWEQALRAAQASLDGLVTQAGSINNTYMVMRSQADKKKQQASFLTGDAKAKIDPLLTAVYDALGTGPIEKVNAALVSLNEGFASLP